MAAKFLPPSKLITAIRAGKLSEVTEALNNGADPEEADMHGFVGLPLRTACFEGNVEIVQELLSRGVNINAIAGDGPNAPMRLAQRGKHQQVVTLLVQYGATPTDTGPKVMAEPTALFPTQKQVSATDVEELPATLVMRPFNFDTLATQTYTLASDERLAEASTAALAIVVVGLLPLIALSRQISRTRRA
jgi:hypothetical protein